MSRFNRTKKGFTLVELLVVISIIAMLLAMLMPSLQRARESANFVACGANLKQFHLGFTFYANDNNQYTIPGFTWSTGLDRKIPLTRTCPFTREVMDTRKVIDSYFNSPKSWKCPGDARATVFNYQGRSSYIYDWYIHSRKYDHNAYPWTVDDVTTYKVDRFDKTAETHVFAHNWVAERFPYNFDTGEGIYFPHKYLEGAMARGAFSVYLDGHINSSKLTWLESMRISSEITNYYLRKYRY